jgi:hypothetical protein
MPSLVDIFVLFTQFLNSILMFWSEVAVLRHFVLSFLVLPLIGAPDWDFEGRQPNTAIIYVAATFLKVSIKVATFDLWFLGTHVSWMGDAKEQDTPADEEEEAKDAEKLEDPEQPQEPEEPQAPVIRMIVVRGDGVVS